MLALGTRTERLIDALLTLATGERGIDRREPFDLAELARQAAGPLRADAAARGLRLTLRLEPAPAAGDPRLAESLVANLAGNALGHNLPGGWAEVSTGTHGGQAVLTVRNSGPQVPPDQVERLFEPFQRLGASRTGSGQAGGHGLGLAIARAIADAHGGQVTAAARPGGGLDVSASLPGR